MQAFEKEFLVYFNLWVLIAHGKGLKGLIVFLLGKEKESNISLYV